MLLTMKLLNEMLQNWRVQIPTDLKNQLLEDYGNLVDDGKGHVFEYTEQDICEQLRKVVRPFENATKEVKYITLT